MSVAQLVFSLKISHGVVLGKSYSELVWHFSDFAAAVSLLNRVGESFKTPNQPTPPPPVHE